MTAFATNVKVRLDRQAVAKLLGPSGPVDAFARAGAVKIAKLARAQVGVKSRTLQRSIRVTRGVRPAWNVEAGKSPRAPYSAIHHEGRKMLPKRDKLYVFEIDGETVFTFGPIKKVAPNRFLTDSAKRAGFKVTLIKGR